MRPFSKPILPADLVELLEKVGATLSLGQDVGNLVEPMLRSLAAIQASAITRAESEIVDAAQLMWRAQPKSGFMTWFRPRLSNRQQLSRYDGLKYLFLFHRDGHLREMALNMIVEGQTSSFFLAAIAWRLNDWVSPVRKAAVECAARVFPATSDDIIAETACGLFPRIESWGRWGTEREILDECLNRPGTALRLAELLAGGTVGSMSAVLRQALRKGSIDPHLGMIARTAVQPAARALAVRALLSGRATWPDGSEWKWIDKSMGVRHRVTRFASRGIERSISAEAMMALATDDRFVAVRKVAIDVLIREPAAFGNRAAIAAKLASDPNASIRERAAFALQYTPRTIG